MSHERGDRMRSFLAVIVLASSAAAGSLAAQSLEETYAKLCSKPVEAKTEACQILSRSLVEKLQAQQANSAVAQPTAAALPKPKLPERIGAQRWGFFTDFINQELIDIQFENKAVVFTPLNVRYVWEVPGEVIGVQVKQPDGTFKGGVALRWDAAHQGIREFTEGTPGALLEWQPDGSAVATAGGTRMVFRLAQQGIIEILLEGNQGKGWELVNRRHRVKATPSNYEAQALMKQIAANSAATEKLMAEIQQQDRELKSSTNWQMVLAARADAQAERERKREARGNGGQMFGAILQGLAEGFAEANTGGYAEAQANLDATVANIQDAAAAERQQQLYAEQQKSQARASQDRQDRYDESQVLAANAEAAAERARQAGGNSTQSNAGIDAQPRPIATAAKQVESHCSEAPGFRKIFGYAEKTRELAMRSMMETPHLEPLQDVSCTQPPNLGYTLEGWWKCTAMAPTGLMVKHCPQSNSGVSSQ